jgi:hypothetical protein
MRCIILTFAWTISAFTAYHSREHQDALSRRLPEAQPSSGQSQPTLPDITHRAKRERQPRSLCCHVFAVLPRLHVSQHPAASAAGKQPMRRMPAMASAPLQAHLTAAACMQVTNMRTISLILCLCACIVVSAGHTAPDAWHDAECAMQAQRCHQSTAGEAAG